MAGGDLTARVDVVACVVTACCPIFGLCSVHVLSGLGRARNPIPMITAHPDCGTYSGDPNQTDSTGMLCRQFDPPCPQDNGWFRTPGAAETMDTMGLCSGDWVDGVIVDGLIVPSDLAPGDYVLGFRWDCEQTSQVWASCADITVVA